MSNWKDVRKELSITPEEENVMNSNSSDCAVNRCEAGKAKPTIKAMKLIDKYCKKVNTYYNVGEEIAEIK